MVKVNAVRTTAKNQIAVNRPADVTACLLARIVAPIGSTASRAGRIAAAVADSAALGIETSVRLRAELPLV